MSMPQRVPKWWPHQAEFPDWQVWRGNNRLYYARLPGTSPLLIVRGEDATDLRDQIIRAKSRLDTGNSGHQAASQP
jgi:hypothetical protein